jgi:16S rRNA processing protein RimM
MVTVGRIVRPHGHKGAVVVKPETDFASARFREGAELSWMRGGVLGTVRIAAGREFKGRWVVTLEGVDTMNDAETLRDLDLRVSAQALHPLESGAHYVHDLEGCEVWTESGSRIGLVERVQFGAGQPLLVVGGAQGEILVPLIDTICRRIDPVARRITVELPEGLLDLNVVRGGGQDR